MALSGDGLTAKLERFLSGPTQPPYLAVDRDIVVDRYAELRGYFPHATICYAIRSNPAPEIVSMLADVGASFEVTGGSELDLCRSCSVPLHRIAHAGGSGGSRKVAYARVGGVRCFEVDSRHVVTVGGFARALRAALAESPELGEQPLTLAPGDLLVADAGVIQTQVVRIAAAPGAEPTRRVHVNIAEFGSVVSTLDGNLTYRLRTSRTGNSGPALIAGMTPDAAAAQLWVNCTLPLGLAAGDRIQILGAGACGDALQTYCV